MLRTNTQRRKEKPLLDLGLEMAFGNWNPDLLIPERRAGHQQSSFYRRNEGPQACSALPMRALAPSLNPSLPPFLPQESPAQSGLSNRGNALTYVPGMREAGVGSRYGWIQVPSVLSLMCSSSRPHPGLLALHLSAHWPHPLLHPLGSGCQQPLAYNRRAHCLLPV